MKLRLKLTVFIVAICCKSMLAQPGQQVVKIVFPAERNFIVPKKFTANAPQAGDLLAPGRLTLKYLFYNVFSERLAANGYMPVGSISDTVINNTRLYIRNPWRFTDSVKNSENRSKKYYATFLNDSLRGVYTAIAAADEAGYIIMINKIEVHTNIFRSLFSITNYMMDVHFDVYDQNMKFIGGRYIRKYLRADKNTYWTSFTKQFSGLPDELALYFIHMKK